MSGQLVTALEMAKNRPDSSEKPADLLTMHRWVAMRYMTFLVGTGANIVIALTAAVVAKGLVQHFNPAGFAV